MIPVGYMAKRVVGCPEWFAAKNIVDVYSVSNCISKDFTDYIDYWKHNGYWFFDSPEIIFRLAKDNAIDLAGTTLFYYEVHDLQYDDTVRKWTTFVPEPDWRTSVVLPSEKVLEGYDIVTFTMGNCAECSPLSCNRVADNAETNEHCLLRSLDRARQLVEEGLAKDSEPGPFRIFAVYSIKPALAGMEERS